MQCSTYSTCMLKYVRTYLHVQYSSEIARACSICLQTNTVHAYGLVPPNCRGRRIYAENIASCEVGSVCSWILSNSVSARTNCSISGDLICLLFLSNPFLESRLHSISELRLSHHNGPVKPTARKLLQRTFDMGRRPERCSTMEVQTTSYSYSVACCVRAQLQQGTCPTGQCNHSCSQCGIQERIRELFTPSGLRNRAILAALFHL